MVKSNGLIFTEISSLQDELLLSWLVLYETAFPASERLLVASILSILKKEIDVDQGKISLLAVKNRSDEMVGMAMYSVHPDSDVAALWYLAVVKEMRGMGFGSIIYHEVLRRVNSLRVGTLVFEVEIPENQNAQEALQRIRFYLKQGAFLLTGIHYMQDIGWHQPPIPMHVMVHPGGPMDALSAYNRAKVVFGKAIEQVGKLGLVSTI